MVDGGRFYEKLLDEQQGWNNLLTAHPERVSWLKARLTRAAVQGGLVSKNREREELARRTRRIF